MQRDAHSFHFYQIVQASLPTCLIKMNRKWGWTYYKALKDRLDAPEASTGEDGSLFGRGRGERLVGIGGGHRLFERSQEGHAAKAKQGREQGQFD